MPDSLNAAIAATKCVGCAVHRRGEMRTSYPSDMGTAVLGLCFDRVEEAIDNPETTCRIDLIKPALPCL